MAVERREIYYAGRVQGVGFRYMTLRLAERFSVTGYVENLPDGRVRLIVEGERSEIDSLQSAIAESMTGHIRSTQAITGSSTGEFSDFTVRR